MVIRYHRLVTAVPQRYIAHLKGAFAGFRGDLYSLQRRNRRLFYERMLASILDPAKIYINTVNKGKDLRLTFLTSLPSEPLASDHVAGDDEPGTANVYSALTIISQPLATPVSDTVTTIAKRVEVILTMDHIDKRRRVTDRRNKDTEPVKLDPLYRAHLSAQDGTEMDASLSGRDAFPYAQAVCLRLCSTSKRKYEEALGLSSVSSLPKTSKSLILPESLTMLVFWDPPLVETFNVNQMVLAGYPICPKLNFSPSASKIRISWNAINQRHPPLKNTIQAVDQLDDSVELFNEEFGSATFTPSEDLLGHRMFGVAWPYGADGKLGLPSIGWVPGRVAPGAQNCLFDDTHNLIRETPLPKEHIRVVSYNVLADIYVKPGAEGFFPYADEEKIHRYYRRPVLFKELEGYNADIVCLQELDFSLHRCFLSAFMAGNGYDTGFGTDYQHGFVKKGGAVGEGCAIYYKMDKFSLHSSSSTILSDLTRNDVTEDICPGIEAIRGLIQQVAPTLALWCNLKNTVQVTTLRWRQDSSRYIMVGNTHLYFSPKVPHVKLLQLVLCFRFLEKAMLELKQEDPSAKISIIFCGDLNSLPGSSVCQFALNGHIGSDHKEWHAGSNDEMTFVGKDLSHPFTFRSAVGIPKFTNYTEEFNGTLDYIFIDPSFNIERVFELPSEEEVSKYTALPSPECPSDHLPLLCDLRLI